jgi:hypothetical protein
VTALLKGDRCLMHLDGVLHYKMRVNFRTPMQGRPAGQPFQCARVTGCIDHIAGYLRVLPMNSWRLAGVLSPAILTTSLATCVSYP